MKKYPHFPINSPKSALALGVLALVLFGTFAGAFPKIDMNPTLKSMIMPNDRDREFDEEAKQVFGDDEFIVLAIENDDGVFNTETIELIDQLSKKALELEGIREVYSLTENDNIRAGEGGDLLDTSPLIDEVPQTEEELNRIEKETFENPTFPRAVVSDDKKVAAVVIEFMLSHSDYEDRSEITEEIRTLADDADAEADFAEIYLTGFPVTSHESAKLQLGDAVVFGNASTLILLIVVAFIFRAAQPVLFTILVANIGVAVAYGAMALSGVPMSLPTSSVMPFLTALGMQYSVYVGYAYIGEMLRWRDRGDDTGDHRAVLAGAVRRVRPAVLLSMVTTCIGFLSMLANPVQDLAHLGLFLAVGTAACGLAAITVIPAFIALWPFKVKERSQHNRATNWLIDKVATSTSRRAKAHLMLAGIITVAAASAWTQLEADTDPIKYFQADAEVREDAEFVRERMGGAGYLRAVVVGEELDTFKKPENLRKLREIAEYAETLPNVRKAVSQADSVSLINRALRGGGEEDYEIPDTEKEVENWLALHDDPTEFRLLIDHDYRWAAIGLRVNTMSSSRLTQIEKDVEAFMAETFADFEVNVVGTTMLVVRALDEMAVSMIVSLGIVLVAIFVVILAMFRSVKLALLAIVPNGIPIIMNYAIVGLLGIPLDPPIAITGAIALGIAIDDTIHFFKSWLHFREEGLSAEEAVQRTLQYVGRPMILSSIVLAAGFSVTMLSAYGVLVWTGVMLCITAFNTLLSDLLVTPAMLSVMRSKGGTGAPAR